MNNKKEILSVIDNLKEGDQDKKYDLPKEVLKESNELLKNVSLETVNKKLKKKPKEEKDFDKVWKFFSENEYAKEFKSYMGYGVEEIEKVGVEKFLKAVDWSIDNVKNHQWTRDAVKVLICGECKNEFTTFQLDYGLCDNCKPKFDIARFEKSLSALEKKIPGSSEQEIMLFTFFEEYRECYKKLSDDEIIKAIKDGNFVSPNAILLILESLKENKENIVEVILEDLLSYINENPEARQWHNKLYSLIKENKLDVIVEQYL